MVSVSVTSIPAGTLGDKWLFAKWTSMHITYDLNGGTDPYNPSYYDKATGVASFAEPTRVGYTFIGWFNDKNDEQVTSIPAGTTGPFYLYAKWEIKTFAVSFDSNGGSGTMENGTVYYNGSYKLPSCTLTPPAGMLFDYWQVGDTHYQPQNFVKNVTANVTVRAVWKWTYHDVTFNANGRGTAPATQANIQYGTKATEPEAPTTEGYTFCGWYKEPACENRWEFTRENVTQDMTLYAKWSANSYRVTYQMNGGENQTSNPVSYSYEDADIILAAPTKTGYTFTGWTYSGQNTPQLSVTIPQHSTQDKEFTANWQVNQYTMTFKDGDQVIASYTQDFGTPITEPAPLNKRRNIWDCWGPNVPETMPAEDMTIDAQWHQLAYLEAVPATCTAAGNVEYYYGYVNGKRHFREVEDNGNYIYQELTWPQDVIIPPMGHIWEDNPTWSWEYNYLGELMAVIKLECMVCGYYSMTYTTEFTENVIMEPTVTEDGEVEYTATIDMYGRDYSDTHRVVLPKTGIVARIGNTEYPYLKDALDAARSGDEVTVLEDIYEPTTSCGNWPYYQAGFVLDLNGHNVTLKSLLMEANLTVKNGTLNCQMANDNEGNSNTLTLENATLNCPIGAEEWSYSLNWMAQRIAVTSGSTLNIAGNTYLGGGADDGFYLSIDYTSRVVLKNAALNGYNSDRVRSQFAQYMPAGYTVDDEGKVVYEGNEYTDPVTLTGNAIFLYDEKNNNFTLRRNVSISVPSLVTIENHTLRKDGNWNILCLPFNITAEQLAEETHPLHGAEIEELDTETLVDGHATGYANGTLYLNFKSVTSITAGKPFIVKWTPAYDYDNWPEFYDISNPVFSGVIIDDENRDAMSSDGALVLYGNYSALPLKNGNRVVLYFGDENKLYTPSDTETLNSFRGYFMFGSEYAGKDVNGDGNVAISDVPALVNSILDGNPAEVGDINGDGHVSIADVTALVSSVKLQNAHITNIVSNVGLNLGSDASSPR